MAHEHNLKKCEPPCEAPGRCNWCDGGLKYCLTCTGGEVDLPTECPGYEMTDDQRRRVSHGWIDFRGGKLVALGKHDAQGRAYVERRDGVRFYLKEYPDART